MKQSKYTLKNLLKENKWVFVLFILSTFIFLYQHSIALSWDFASYILNAKYWFANGNYFEPLRAPLMPFILGIFSFFGWKISEYLYIVFVSFLFMLSSIKLAGSLKFNKNIFYILSLNFYVLLTGLINGTELLSLVFLEFFLASLIKNKNSGIFLGLASLSRYTCISLFPLLIFHKNLKSIIKNFILFVIPFTPWFVYNYIVFGNMFMSIADSYANNIYFRDYIHQSINYLHILEVTNFLLPLFLIGLVCTAVTFYKLFKNKKFISNLKVFFNKHIPDIIMLLLLIFSLYGYYKVPIKNARYLFNLVIPAVYFSMIGINSVRLKRINFKRLAALIIILLNISFLAGYSAIYGEPNIYEEALDKVESLGIKNNCSLKSNSWVFLNYLDRTTGIFPRKELISYYLNEGDYLLFFHHVEEPDYVHNKTFLSKFPIIHQSDSYILIGNKTQCKPIKKVDSTYLANLNNTIYLMHNYSTDINPCNILFSNKLIRKTCDIVNLK